MTKSTATPTTLRIGPYYRHEIVSDQGTFCCAPIETEANRQNMAEVCRRWNAFEPMVEALREIVRQFTTNTHQPPCCRTDIPELPPCAGCIAKAALKLAGEL